MFVFLTVVLYATLVAANPIKRAKNIFSHKRGVTQDDFLVSKLPGLHENFAADEVPLMYAGQLELYHNNNTHYFFWKFVDQQKQPEAQNKTIFWLNGGPGCSSMDGALMEAGPLRVNDKGKVVQNNGSWHRMGDIVFVDQPAGTGFSYSAEFDAELDEVSWHFLTFLQKYFAVFPEDLTNEILLAGESYAGQYIPYIARAILDRNARISRDTASTAAEYNLRGLLIGNGYIAPNEQGLSFVPFAVQAGMIDTNHPHWQELLRAHEECQKAVDSAVAADTVHAYSVVDSTCDRVLAQLLSFTKDPSAPRDQQCYNMYDYTLKDSYPSCGMNWPPDLANVSPFLANDQVMVDLNLVFHKHWKECSGPVGSHLKAKKSYPSIKLLPGLLQELEIVLFNGNRDIICNYLGTEAMIKKLKWGGSTGFSGDALVYDWRHNGTVAGYVKSERNLTFINVFEASHMVPFDKPEESRALVDIIYKRYDVATGKNDKPEIRTYPLGQKGPAASGTEDESAAGVSSASAASNSVSSAAHSNATGASSESETGQQHTSRMVRVIQLAVIVVLIWGVCALYMSYQSKPTSIIKTKSLVRKKNVSWADQLEEEVQDSGDAHGPDSSIFSKAFSKFKTPDSQGKYERVNSDIEMREGLPEQDDFIIGSDDEESNELR